MSRTALALCAVLLLGSSSWEVTAEDLPTALRNRFAELDLETGTERLGSASNRLPTEIGGQSLVAMRKIGHVQGGVYVITSPKGLRQCELGIGSFCPEPGSYWVYVEKKHSASERIAQGRKMLGSGGRETKKYSMLRYNQTLAHNVESKSGHAACVAVHLTMHNRNPYRAAALLILLGLIGASTSAHAGGGFLPPLKIDLGSLAQRDGSGRTTTGTALLMGLHWATLNPKRSSIDFGVGYVGSFFPDSVGVHRLPQPTNALLSAHGGYFEFAMLAHERPHVRTWLSGRAELMQSGGVGILGMATRVSTELWSGLLHGNGGSGIVGSAALGLWAEVGVRELPQRGYAPLLSVGISGRLPLVLASH